MATKTQPGAISALAKKAASSAKDGTTNGNSSKGSRTKSVADSSGKKEKTLQTLFEDLLKDTYSAEKQLLKALPEVAKAAYSEELEDAVTDHLEQTKKHVERLDKVFDRLRIDKGDEEKCEAMEGLILENKQVIEEYEEGPVRDSALIIGSQKIEHYEIAAYGSLCELAEVLGFHKVCEILDRTLGEEEETDQLLTEIAVGINDEAYEMSEEEEYH